MDHAARIDAVERELDGLITAVGDGPLDAPVPTCPEFTVDDLADHVGLFCGFWTHVLCEGTGREKTPFGAVGPDGRAEWLRTAGGYLVAELRATPPDTTVWTWYEPDQSAAFVARRVANELAIHRVDAEVARGAAAPVASDLAIDGIDEFLVLLMNDKELPPRDGPNHTIHLHGTDRDDAEWLIVVESEQIRVTREHANADLALRGSVSDLEMLLYQRPTVGPVERFGDESILAEFHEAFVF